MTPDAITEYIHNHLPLTTHMNARVDSYDGERIIIGAPLSGNTNPHNTVFGGTISAMGILSGWALIFLKLREEVPEATLVIHKSSTEFIKPITADFKAACSTPKEEEWKEFTQNIKRWGKARLLLKSEIIVGGTVAGMHEGVYVAILK